MSAGATISIFRSEVASLVGGYCELVKARVTAMIVMTAWVGAYIGAQQVEPSAALKMAGVLFAIGAVAAGTAALNECMEVDIDARMRRTVRRPLVTGAIEKRTAVAVGCVLVAGGVIYLATTSGVLAAALSAATSAIYLLLYTPLKQKHPVCTTIGAVAGAMPPVLGYVAVRGHVDWFCVELFAVLFFWQFPHFHAIAMIYREDYSRSGIRMLAVVDKRGYSVARSVMFTTAALVAVSVWMTVAGGSLIYTAAAVLLGCAMVFKSVRFARHVGAGDPVTAARHLLHATLWYLPALLTVVVAETRFK